MVTVMEICITQNIEILLHNQPHKPSYDVGMVTTQH